MASCQEGLDRRVSSATVQYGLSHAAHGIAEHIVVVGSAWDEIEPIRGCSSFRTELDINFKGALRVCHAVVPGMVERGFGRVINIGSDAGRVPICQRNDDCDGRPAWSKVTWRPLPASRRPSRL